MRSLRGCTRVSTFILLIGIAARAAQAQPAGSQPAPGAPPAAGGATPEDAEFRAVDEALEQGRAALALQLLQRADPRLREQPAGALRAARAYFQLGELLGEAEVRTVADGRTGQFAGNFLLVEPRPGRNRFLCCPRASALYQLRAALDGGLDDPAAHLLHARIWHRLGRPEVALAILRARADVLLSAAGEEALNTYSRIALEADALADYLRCAALRAARCPERRHAIMRDACLTLAERYGQRGDETLHIEWLRRAVRHQPDETDLWVRLADAEWAAGRAGEAARHYGRALQLAPGHPERGRILERLAESGAHAEP
ncbi:MAG: hypothetical protein AB1601_10110 [Planctomycetota bacterium]